MNAQGTQEDRSTHGDVLPSPSVPAGASRDTQTPLSRGLFLAPGISYPPRLRCSDLNPIDIRVFLNYPCQ